MVTSLYAAILSLFFVFLSVNVVRSRRAFKIAIGDDNPEIKRRIRAQGNFIEYTPLFLILLFLAEKGGTNIYLIHVIGLTYIIGRIMHAYSLLIDEKYTDTNGLLISPKWRIRGMKITFSCFILLAIFNLITFIH